MHFPPLSPHPHKAITSQFLKNKKVQAEAGTHLSRSEMSLTTQETINENSVTITDEWAEVDASLVKAHPQNERFSNPSSV